MGRSKKRARRLWDAYSDLNRPVIPKQTGHPFRSKPATVTEQFGHLLGRLKEATLDNRAVTLRVEKQGGVDSQHEIIYAQDQRSSPADTRQKVERTPSGARRPEKPKSPKSKKGQIFTLAFLLFEVVETLMTRPLRILLPGGYYHVTCRGNDRRSIFRDDHDRSVFLEKLRGSLANYQVELHAYVLMSNHFHLLVSTPKGNLSEFMRHFNISYTAAFNRRHRRVGHLYQGRYKAILVDQDSYLLELSRYLHLNPIRLKSYQGSGVRERMRYLERYRWSSLPGYMKTANKQPWVHYEMVLGQVGGSRKKYAEFVSEGIERGYDTPWENVTGQVVLGQEGFIEGIKRKVAGGGAVREQPSAREFTAKSVAVILREVCKRFGVKGEEITGKRIGHREERALAMEMLYRHGQLSQAAIGKVLGGLDYTTVSRERKRLRERAQEDKRFGAALSKMDESLRLK